MVRSDGGQGLPQYQFQALLRLLDMLLCLLLQQYPQRLKLLRRDASSVTTLRAVFVQNIDKTWFAKLFPVRSTSKNGFILTREKMERAEAVEQKSWSTCKEKANGKHKKKVSVKRFQTVPKC